MKPRPRSRKNLVRPEPLDHLLDRASEARFSRHRSPISDRIWIEAVGLRIAERARPISLKAGVLTVRTATSVWSNELSMLASPILARLQRAGVLVTELRFRVGQVDAPARPPERRESRAVPPPAPLTGALRNELDQVSDAELRDSLEAAASANLAWQRATRPPPAR